MWSIAISETGRQAKNHEANLQPGNPAKPASNAGIHFGSRMRFVAGLVIGRSIVFLFLFPTRTWLVRFCGMLGRLLEQALAEHEFLQLFFPRLFCQAIKRAKARFPLIPECIAAMIALPEIHVYLPVKPSSY
jgi:hypothetical protein